MAFFKIIGKQLFHLISSRDERLSHNRIAFWILFAIFSWRYFLHGVEEISPHLILLLLVFAGYEISKLVFLKTNGQVDRVDKTTTRGKKMLLEKKAEAKDKSS